jgi:negative regulator of genetic competence, sporulation and motility
VNLFYSILDEKKTQKQFGIVGPLLPAPRIFMQKIIVSVLTIALKTLSWCAIPMENK